MGDWIGSQRSKKDKLIPEKITRLESLNGWVWNTLDYKWEKGFLELTRYIKQNRHLKLSHKYETKDGFNLGSWVSGQRSRKDKLTPEQITRLESLNGWVWGILEFQWQQEISYLKAFVEQEGHARVPTDHEEDGGFNLGVWVQNHRKRKDELSPERLFLLDSLGFEWDIYLNRSEKGFMYLEEYVKQNDHTRVPNGHETDDGYPLGNWVVNRK